MSFKGTTHINRMTIRKDVARSIALRLSNALRGASITGWIRTRDAGRLIGESASNVASTASTHGTIYDSRIFDIDQGQVLCIKLKPISGGDVLPEHSPERMNRVARQAQALASGKMVY